ncbi:MAG: type II secretion system F family protein [Caldisericia bacterium]
MPTWKYEAKDKLGATVRGLVNASDAIAGSDQLSQQGLLILSLRRHHALPTTSIRNAVLGTRVPAREMVIFTDQFAMLIESGLSLVDALGILREQTGSSTLKDILSRSTQSIREGASLSQAFARFPTVFPNAYVELLRVAEASGNLDKVLRALSVDMQKQYEIRQKITSALAYPKFAFTVVVGVVVFMLVLIMPKFVSMYASARVELPVPTRIVMALSAFIRKDWTFVVAGVVLLFLAFKALYRVASVHESVDRVTLHVPVIGSIVYMGSLTRFTRSLALLQRSGINVLAALHLARGSLQNAWLENHVATVIQYVEAGQPMSDGFVRAGVFPPMLAKMTAVGERGGRVDAMLERLSFFWDEDLDHRIKRLSSQLEPAMIVVLGIVVGFIALAMYLPMFSMTQLMSR